MNSYDKYHFDMMNNYGMFPKTSNVINQNDQIKRQPHKGLDKTNYNLSKYQFATCPSWRKKTNVFDDPAAVNIRERQSVDTGDYQVTNFFRKCNEPIFTDCTLNQTFTYPKVWGNIYQCEVNKDSELRYSSLTNLRNVQQLFTTPYKTQPYQGAGTNSLDQKNLESSLIQGQSTTTYKGCENSNEIYIDRYQYLPEYGNPQKIERVIEPWTRGGTNTRELQRKVSINDYCNNMKKVRAY